MFSGARNLSTKPSFRLGEVIYGASCRHVMPSGGEGNSGACDQVNSELSPLPIRPLVQLVQLRAALSFLNHDLKAAKAAAFCAIFTRVRLWVNMGGPRSPVFWPESLHFLFFVKMEGYGLETHDIVKNSETVSCIKRGWCCG